MGMWSGSLAIIPAPRGYPEGNEDQAPGWAVGKGRPKAEDTHLLSLHALTVTFPTAGAGTAISTLERRKRQVRLGVLGAESTHPQIQKGGTNTGSTGEWRTHPPPQPSPGTVSRLWASHASPPKGPKRDRQTGHIVDLKYKIQGPER